MTDCLTMALPARCGPGRLARPLAQPEFEFARERCNSSGLLRPPDEILNQIFAHLDKLARPESRNSPANPVGCAMREDMRPGRDRGLYGSSTVIDANGKIFVHWATPRDFHQARKRCFDAFRSLVTSVTGVYGVDVDSYTECYGSDSLVGELWTIHTRPMD